MCPKVTGLTDFHEKIPEKTGAFTLLMESGACPDAMRR